MDLGIPMSRIPASKDYPKRQKKCMECGKILEKDGSHLYYQRFCSALCKEKYCEL